MNDFFEKCWFIYGIKIKNFYIGFVLKHSNGVAAGVEFDWEKIYNSKYIIGFFHTHPNGMLNYSDTDYRTMNAWVSCLWRNLICGIWNEERSKNICYLFKKDKTREILKCYNSKAIFIGKK